MPWIGFDWDNTLQTPHDQPTPLVPFVKWLLEHNVEVRIVTARVNSQESRQHIKAHTDHIDERCNKWFGRTLKVQAEKDYDMVLLFDDRAVSVERDTGRIFGAPSMKWDPEPPADIALKFVRTPCVHCGKD